MPIPEINLDLDGDDQPFTLSSAGSVPSKGKYHVDEIKDHTPCTLVYIKGTSSWTIEVAKAIVMHSRIIHGRPFPAKCVVVKEGREFENFDYPNEEEGIEKLVDAKRAFILWPHKDIIIKTRLASIVSLWSTKVRGTPTSNMSMLA
jgi:hypothetical protein